MPHPADTFVTEKLDHFGSPLYFFGQPLQEGGGIEIPSDGLRVA
jgi:hypothetical protein